MRFSVEGGDEPSVFTIVLQGGGPGREGGCEIL